LSEDLVGAFKKRPVDPVGIAECRERLALLFEKGLRVMLVLFVNASVSMLNRGGMCPIVYRGGAMNTLNSSGNFKAIPSYCHAGSAKEQSLNDTKHFRNLDFATTSPMAVLPRNLAGSYFKQRVIKSLC